MSSSEGKAISATVSNENGNINVDDRQMAASMNAKTNNQDSGSESRCDGMDPVSNFLPLRAKPLKNSEKRRRLFKPTASSSAKVGSGNGEPQRYHSLRMTASNDPSVGRPALGRARKRTVKPTTTQSSSNIGSGNGEPQRYHSLRMRASNDPSLGRPASGRAKKKTIKETKKRFIVQTVEEE